MNKIWFSIKAFTYNNIIFNVTHIGWNVKRFVFRCKKIKDFIKLAMKDNDFDFGFALSLEKYKLEKMIKFFMSNDTHVENDYAIAKDLKLAYNLLLIVRGDVDVATIIEYPKCEKEGAFYKVSKPAKYKMLRYVNTRNAERFASSDEEKKIWKTIDKDEVFKENLYQQKAWYLYNKLRYYKMNEWWD